MMNKKDKSSGSLKEKGNPGILNSSSNLEKMATVSSFAISKKNEAPVKARSPVTLLRDKFSKLIGRCPGTSNPLVAPHGFSNKNLAKPDKASLHPDMPGPDSKIGISKLDALKTGRKKVMSPDINSLSVRLSELEEHTREMHAKFDEFVLKSEKFMDYGQFIEVRKEVEEKIRLLDKIEKSLDDSRNQILKDSGYMDSILTGFKYTKERIEILEKQMDSLLKADREKSHPSLLNKFRGAVDPQNIKSRIDSPKLSGLGRTVSELKKQMDALKESESNALKELESMKGKMVSQEALESVRSRMYYLSKARKQNHVAEFEKKQDELKDEMAKLKRDIRQIPAMQSSMEQISLAVNSLREDIRKDVDSKSMQSIDRGARDDDIAEVRGNIEKLKAMSQDL